MGQQNDEFIYRSEVRVDGMKWILGKVNGAKSDRGVLDPVGRPLPLDDGRVPLEDLLDTVPHYVNEEEDEANKEAIAEPISALTRQHFGTNSAVPVQVIKGCKYFLLHLTSQKGFYEVH